MSLQMRTRQVVPVAGAQAAQRLALWQAWQQVVAQVVPMAGQAARQLALSRAWQHLVAQVVLATGAQAALCLEAQDLPL